MFYGDNVKMKYIRKGITDFILKVKVNILAETAQSCCFVAELGLLRRCNSRACLATVNSASTARTAMIAIMWHSKYLSTVANNMEEDLVVQDGGLSASGFRQWTKLCYACNKNRNTCTGTNVLKDFLLTCYIRWSDRADRTAVFRQKRYSGLAHLVV